MLTTCTAHSRLVPVLAAHLSSTCNSRKEAWKKGERLERHCVPGAFRIFLELETWRGLATHTPTSKSPDMSMTIDTLGPLVGYNCVSILSCASSCCSSGFMGILQSKSIMFCRVQPCVGGEKFMGNVSGFLGGGAVPARASAQRLYQCSASPPHGVCRSSLVFYIL